MTATTDRTAVLSARGITKSYGHVHALRGVDFDVYPAETVALIGDNGAGKSTLVKILSGATTHDGGAILIDGTPTTMTSPADARAQGIETVYQDLALATDLDTPANIYLGRELYLQGLLGRLGFLDKKSMSSRSEELYRGLHITPVGLQRPVMALSGGQRQSVAVARAAAWASRLVLMDEPTAALGHEQTRAVYELIRRINGKGIAVVLISHNLPDVLANSDRIEVLRHGKRAAVYDTARASLDEVVMAMAGGSAA